MTKDIQAAILRACAKFINGKLEPLTKRLAELETKTMEVPLDGVIKELLTTEELATLVNLHVGEAITKHFEANPIKHGMDGKPGDRGEKGDPGADGVGLASAMIDRDGQLVVTKTNGESVPLGPVIGKDGEKGADGKDGADFTETDFEYDGERTLTIRGKGGDIVKRLPIPIDRGYWRDGMKAEKSDVVTQDGSAWIALKDTDKAPGHDAKEDWRMMARKGRDGAQGPAGKEYVPPAPVKLS